VKIALVMVSNQLFDHAGAEALMGRLLDWRPSLLGPIEDEFAVCSKRPFDLNTAFGTLASFTQSRQRQMPCRSKARCDFTQAQNRRHAAAAARSLPASLIVGVNFYSVDASA
jgi:hypothetical protein